MGKCWNVRSLFVQELEHVGRCLMVPTEGSRLPRVSGERAEVEVEAEVGRLASVSKAASSQEPEPEPEKGQTKLQVRQTG